MVNDRDKIVAGWSGTQENVIRTKWYWLKSLYLIKAVFNSSSQQTVTIIEVLKES